jgi:hypothetical protein
MKTGLFDCSCEELELAAAFDGCVFVCDAPSQTKSSNDWHHLADQVQKNMIRLSFLVSIRFTFSSVR